MKNKEEINYICSDCGKGYGKIQGAVTMHMGNCDKCGEKGYLAHVRDYRENDPLWD